jgi:hypothetical protein
MPMPMGPRRLVAVLLYLSPGVHRAASFPSGWHTTIVNSTLYVHIHTRYGLGRKLAAWLAYGRADLGDLTASQPHLVGWLVFFLGAPQWGSAEASASLLRFSCVRGALKGGEVDTPLSIHREHGAGPD